MYSMNNPGIKKERKKYHMHLLHHLDRLLVDRVSISAGFSIGNIESTGDTALYPVTVTFSSVLSVHLVLSLSFSLEPLRL